MKNIKIDFAAFIFVTVLFLSGCATQSKVQFTQAPDAPEGYGLVYVLKEGGGLMGITSVTIRPLDQQNLDGTRSFYLVQGEYSWTHLKSGMYEASHTHSGSGETIKINFKVQNQKASYIKLSYANPQYLIITQLPSEQALESLKEYKYWEYKKKKCSLTMTCR
jgi:hypothetical protein